MQTNTTFGIIAGILIVVLLAGALSLFLQPSEQKGDIFVINKGSSNSTDSTECINLGTGADVIKNSTSGNCYVKSIQGSSDISVTNTSNTIIIDFNGTSGGCTNLDCLTDVAIVNLDNNHILQYNITSGQFENRGYFLTTDYNFTEDSGAMFLKNRNGDFTPQFVIANFNNTDDNSQLDLWSKDCISGACSELSLDANDSFNKITSSNGISNIPLSIIVRNSTGIPKTWQLYYNGTTFLPTNGNIHQNGNSFTFPSIGGAFLTTSSVINDFSDVIITSPSNGQVLAYNSGNWINVTPTVYQNNTGTNLGSVGEGIYTSNNGAVLQFKKLVGGTGINLSSNSTRITISTNFVNGTGISITGSTTQTFTNTGVISNSCSSPISCSGTNPSNISCSTCVTTSSYPLQWTLLNSTSPTDGATTWTINIASKKFLYVDLWIKGNQTVVTAGSWNLRFNSDSASNYGYYQDLRGTVTQASINAATSCNLFNADENWSYYQTWRGYNLNTENKIMNVRSDSYSTNAVSGGGYSSVDCAWSNTSNAITSITILRTSGTFTLDSSSTIWIYGHD